MAAADFVNSTLSRLSVTTDAEKAAATSDLVVEAIVEKLAIKQKLFTALDAVRSLLRSSTVFQVGN